MRLVPRSPFDPPLDEMRTLGGAVVDIASRFVDARYAAKSFDNGDLDDLLAALAAPPPRRGTNATELFAQIEHASTKGFDPANPGFMAYIPGGGLYAAALGGFLAGGVNRYPGIARPAPAFVAMEAALLRWLCDLFELPAGSQGVLTP